MTTPTVAPPNADSGGVELFTDTTTQGDLDTADDPTIVRSRFVDVNFELLAGADGPPGSQSGSDVLVLNLFEDVSFTAVLDRVEGRPPDSLTWIGHLEGVEHSQVTLVVDGGVLTGDIALPGAFYQVRYAGNGVYTIYQIGQLPSDADMSDSDMGVSGHEDLVSRVQSDGTVQVIVGLDVVTVGDEPASPDEIAEAQAALLDALSSYNVTVIAQYTVIPFMALEVDEAALRYLIASPQVTSIEEDVAVPPAE